MYKARRGEVRQWLSELRKLADQRVVPVFPPIGDLASLASYRLDGHPYAPVAIAVEQVLHSAALVQGTVSLAAIRDVARTVPAVQDRIAYEVPVADVLPSPRDPRYKI